MNILALLLQLAIFGFCVWLILLIPMPPVLSKVIIGVAIVLVVLWFLNALGDTAITGRSNFPFFRR